MRNRCFCIVLVCFALSLCHSAASAEPVTWQFLGTMTNGEPFSGWFTFETDTPDSSPTTPLRGDYSNAGIDWQFVVGGTVISPITTQGWSGNFEIFDDIQTNEAPFILGDHFRIYADADPATYQSNVVAGIDLFFEDSTGKLLRSDSLLSRPPNLHRLNFGEGGWADHFGLQFAAEFRLIGVNGNTIAAGEIQRVRVSK